MKAIWNNRILSAVSWSAVEQFGAQGIQLGVVLMLARLLNKSDFGLIALTNFVCAFLLIFARKGFDDAIIQRRELSARIKDSAFWTSLSAGVALTLIACLISPVAAMFFEEPKAGPVLRVLSLGMLFGSLAALPQALLKRELHFKPIALRSIGGRTAGGIVGIAMALADMGVWSLVAMQLTGEAVSTLLLWAACRYRPGFDFSLSDSRQLLDFGIKVIGAQIMNFLNRRLDIFIVAKFFGMEVLGMYSIAMKVIDLSVAIFMGVFGQVGYPVMCRLSADMERFRRIVPAALEGIIVLVTPFVLILTLYSSTCVHLLFGSKWANAVPIMTILAPLLLVKIPSWAEALGIIALGKPGARFKLAALFAAISASSMFSAAFWGIHWLAFASSLRYFIVAVPTALVFCKFSGIGIKTMLPIHFIPLFAGILTIGTSSQIAFRLAPQDITLQGLCVLLGLSLYASWMYAIRKKVVNELLGILKRENGNVSMKKKAATA